MAKVEMLKLNDIRLDAGTQTRCWLHTDTVDEYAERMEAGDKFPPADVFFDGKEYFMADGFHRAHAAYKLERTALECKVHDGTLMDALWFAIGANAANGLRRALPDKRKAVEIALIKFPEKSQRDIAAHVGCALGYVNQIKQQFSSEQLTLPKTRKGKDGKNYPTTRTSKAKTAPKEEAPEPPRIRSASEILAEQEEEDQVAEVAAQPAPPPGNPPPAPEPEAAPEPPPEAAKKRIRTTGLADEFVALWNRMEEGDREFVRLYVEKAKLFGE